MVNFTTDWCQKHPIYYHMEGNFFLWADKFWNAFQNFEKNDVFQQFPLPKYYQDFDVKTKLEFYNNLEKS